MILPVSKRLQGKTPSHARARAQEKETADRIGARQTKGSGCGDEGGDSRKKKIVRIENKTTKHMSFRVTPELLDDLEHKAFGADEIPILQVELGLGKFRCLVIPDWALEFIVEALENANK